MESTSIRIRISIVVIGRMTKKMDMECTSIKKEKKSTKGIIYSICFREWVDGERQGHGTMIYANNDYV